MTATTKDKKIKHLFLAGFAAAVILVITIPIFSSKKVVRNIKAVTSAEQLVFNPAKIDLSSNEILNPGRGYQRWNGQEIVPVVDGVNQSNNSYDSYMRFTWDQLESDTAPATVDSPGDYSTGIALISSKAAEAKARGGQFSFRIYVYCPDCSNTRSASGEINRKLPKYITDNSATYNGWTKYGANNSSSTDDYYVPDWNNENFLKRVDQLLKGLGDAFADDNRIGSIDIGIYGMWGEFHMYCMYPYPDNPYACVPDQTPPSGITDITTANLQSIIDMHINRFNTKRLLALVDQTAITYTSNKTTQAGAIGWRGDCLGLEDGEDPAESDGDILNSKEHFRRIQGIEPESSSSWATIWNNELKDRWKVAPITVEGCPFYAKRWKGNKELNDVQAAYNQVLDYHVSQIGNGNVRRYDSGTSSLTFSGTIAQKWDSFSETISGTKTQKQVLIEMGKKAGYRYELNEISLPQIIGKGETFNINTKWINSGIAPIYDNWDVWIRLKNTSNSEVWETKSSTNLKNIYNLSTTENTVFSVADSVLIPENSVSAGTYTVSLIIKEPDSTNPSFPNYRAPLALATQGRQSDGSYLMSSVDTVTIAEAATPTPTATPTAEPTMEPTSTPTITPIITVEPTIVPTTTSTPVPTNTPTASPTLIPTSTVTPTVTQIPTQTPTTTQSPTPTPTQAPTVTPTSTTVPTATSTSQPTSTPTVTAQPTKTPTVIPTSTVTPIKIVSTQVPTATQQIVNTPVPTQSNSTNSNITPTNKIAFVTSTPKPTSVIKNTTPSKVPTANISSTPTVEPTISPTTTTTPTVTSVITPTQVQESSSDVKVQSVSEETSNKTWLLIISFGSGLSILTLVVILNKFIK